MSNRSNTPLAELHLHLYGATRAVDFLNYVYKKEIDWSSYEAEYERVFGERSAIQDIVQRHRRGHDQAIDDFRQVFVFGDADAGDFTRFQTKMDLMRHGSEIVNYQKDISALPALVEETRYIVSKTVLDHKRQNIGYVEHRMLTGFTLSAADSHTLLSAILETLADHATHEFEPRLAVSLPRENPWPQWEVTQELALGPYGELLSAVDFYNVEEGHPPKRQESFFRAVGDFNRRHPHRALAVLYHVGESYRDKSLESAIRWVHEAAEMGPIGWATPSRWGSTPRCTVSADGPRRLRSE